jgi:hypothetical protein
MGHVKPDLFYIRDEGVPVGKTVNAIENMLSMAPPDQLKNRDTCDKGCGMAIMVKS